MDGLRPGSENHSAADRFVGRLIDDDEAARDPAALIRVEEERLRRA